MPYQVSWQSVSMKSQRPVHVLGAALAADTPQQVPAAARIVATNMPSFVMAVPPCLNIDHPDLENDDYKTHSNLSERFQILVASAPQRSCTAWQTGQADPRSKLRLWRELSKPKYKAFDLASALAPPKAAGLLERVIDHNRGFKIIEPWLATKNLSHPRAPFTIMALFCRFDIFPKIDAASAPSLGIVKKALMNEIGIGAPCRSALFA